MIIKEKKTFNISKGASVVFTEDPSEGNGNIQSIKYFTDCVFNPLVYSTFII